jgi:hypothetical protein
MAAARLGLHLGRGNAMHSPDAGPRRITGKLSGLSYDAEPCPESTSRDQLKGAAGGGLLGWGVSFLLGASPGGRLMALLLGAGAGALAAKWHLRVDWDPEALRRSPPPRSDEPRVQEH